MSATTPSSSSIPCRRCGQAYLPDPSLPFPACPHCGAATVPLFKRLRDNRLAALLSFFAAVALVIGILLPFVSIRNEIAGHKTYSMLGGILELFERGNVMLGSILLVFSILFPFAKLLTLLVATSRLVPISDKVRHRLHVAAAVTGRYSMLDLLVIAVMIIVVKFEGLVEVRAESGTVMFSIAVFLSIVAGLCTNLEGKHG
jgi:paraquat-inducible protein A